MSIIGYLPFAILGLKIKEYKRIHLNMTIIICLLISLSLIKNCQEFSPQNYKYPPDVLYIVYGLLICSSLWLIKPIIIHYLKSNKYLEYLSSNSMWIYLWHIVPVYLIKDFGSITNFWFARFCIVIYGAIILHHIYQKFIIYSGLNRYKYLR